MTNPKWQCPHCGQSVAWKHIDRHLAGCRKLTPAELEAYRDLEVAAAKLRKAQQAAKDSRQVKP